MPVTFEVCRDASCGLRGGPLLLHDIEELCVGRAAINARDCLGLCGLGPNVKVSNAAEPYTGVTSFERAKELVEKHVGPVDDRQAQLGLLKFAIRRDSREEVRRALLAEAFGFIDQNGSGGNMGPLAELLVLRAQHRLNTPGDESGERMAAVIDAQRAVNLKPKWGQARRVLANALEAAGSFGEATASLKLAMALGTPLDTLSTRLQLERLQRGLGAQHACAMECHLREVPLRTGVAFRDDSAARAGYEVAKADTTFIWPFCLLHACSTVTADSDSGEES